MTVILCFQVTFPAFADTSIPESLTLIESKSEAVIDGVPDWASVNRDVSAIVKAWKGYLPRAGRDRVAKNLVYRMSTTIAHLKSASTKRQGTVTKQAANDVSRILFDILDTYHPAIPSDIGRLDVLQRQIILDVDRPNLEAARRTMADTCGVWLRLKPVILGHGGAAVTDKFDRSLAVQDGALRGGDGKALANEAKNGLEIIDELEKIFEK